jgi:hypothetical protein
MATPVDNDNLPDIGDAVIFDGDRFRIRDIDADGKALIRPEWGDDRIAVDVNRLRWDRDARAWRPTAKEAA